jgi:isocitrate lyase
VADAEAGFGGVLNAFELMKAMIEAGAAGVHFEDQLASVKKCGHMGGKVLVPTREAVEKLVAARLAADVMRRADADRGAHRRRGRRPADLRHRRQRQAVLHRRAHVEGFFKTDNGLDQAISRGLAYAPYADLVWCETGKPDLEFARKFAEAIHAKFPGKLLAYNCSPSFNWKKNLDDATIAKFQKEIAAIRLQVPVHHPGRFPRAELRHVRPGPRLRAAPDERLRRAAGEAEFAAADRGFTAVKHQREVGTGYFDAITQTIQGGKSSTVALKGSTEEEQFHGERAAA